MKSVVLNGVHLTVASIDEVKTMVQNGTRPSDWIPVGNGLYLYGLRTKGDYMKASGYKEEFDYALPQQWVDHMSKSHRPEYFNWLVWTYAGQLMHGKPLDIRDLLRGKNGIFRKVLAELAK